MCPLGLGSQTGLVPKKALLVSGPAEACSVKMGACRNRNVNVTRKQFCGFLIWNNRDQRFSTASLRHSQRAYDHAIRDFINWYCSEPRLAFNRTVVTRYRINLEQEHYAASTINLRLAAVRRLAYEAADVGAESRPRSRNPPGERSEKAWSAPR